ncbi:MAG: helix-turn-helix transcriptional regulator [Rickettsiales bacterium]|nr:helix-turn-helix transcriptional regulator [Rickettsiales bacterium]
MQKTLTSKRHKALIKLLIESREKAGMTQTALAQQLGEYQSFIARLESGQRRLDVIEFLRLAKLLKFDEIEVLKLLKRLAD